MRGGFQALVPAWSLSPPTSPGTCRMSWSTSSVLVKDVLHRLKAPFTCAEANSCE